MTPLYTFATMRADSDRALRGYRFRRALRLGLLIPGSIALWSLMLTVGTFISATTFT
jgi:hypothetical protein